MCTTATRQRPKTMADEKRDTLYIDTDGRLKTTAKMPLDTRYMGSKRNPGPFDCYADALPDEPMFVLLARDPYAPILVRRWAEWAEINSKDPVKVAVARATAREMEEWRSKHKREDWKPPARFARRKED